MTKDEYVARLKARCMALYTYSIRERILGDRGRGHAHQALKHAHRLAHTIHELQQLTPTAKDSSHGPR